MLFTQFNLDDAMEVRYEEGVEDGIEKGTQIGIEKGTQIGIEKGELLKLIQLVQRKLQKGLTVEAIASDLEEELQLIQQISDAIEQSPSNATPDEIYKTFQSIK